MVRQRHPFGVRLAGILLVHVYGMESEFCRGAVCLAALYVSLLLDEFVEGRALKPGESSR